MIVYDITDRDSYEKMQKWVVELRNHRGNDLPIIIAGNKSDLENNRVVDLSTAEAYARK